jgi:hypothetical protein
MGWCIKTNKTLSIGEADYNPTLLASASGLGSSGSPDHGVGG